MYKFIIFIITYLICSINPAILISKRVIGIDIREVGSGNPGTTNSIRIMGKFWGTVVFILDILKVFIAFYISMLIGVMFKQDTDVVLKSAYLLGAVIGHCFPVYYGFKGGKGMATMLIASFYISPKIAAVCLIVALIIILVTKMVSLGSVCGVSLFWIMTIVMESSYFIPVTIVVLIIIYKHRENIKRIINKEEHKIFD